MDLLDKISLKRRKLCRTFTGHHFSAGHVASQRSEVTNRMIKQHGSIKELLKRSTHYETIKHIFGVISQREIEALDLIKKLIVERKVLTPYVQAKWEEEFRKISDYVLSSEEEGSAGDEVWTVWHKDYPARTRCVKIFKGENCPLPTCSCVDYKSSLIPCRHLTAVMVRLNITLFTEWPIADRWKLCFHPLSS